MVLDIPHLRVVPTIRGKVDADSYGLAPNNVARIMADDRAKNLVPFCLMPTLGTTSTSADRRPHWQVPLGRRFQALCSGSLSVVLEQLGAPRSHPPLCGARQVARKDNRVKLFVRARMDLMCFYVVFDGRELIEHGSAM
ncbi:unnamed protein product [Peronospora destructor]|uniref:Uncharacterized protein n=1 Tax=Peronospora destructor TaxID=86335 RepID=A0AAV0V8Y3_9STRA|nr:unnamed protein product [Peronospora destructor]